jgi:hypothetical protein
MSGDNLFAAKMKEMVQTINENLAELTNSLRLKPPKIWRGKPINEARPPFEYQMYHWHDRFTAWGYFPDQDLSTEPRKIPWQLWLSLVWEPETLTARMPDGRHISNVFVLPAEQEPPDPRQGELPLEELPLEEPFPEKLPPELRPLYQLLVKHAGGVRRKKCEHEKVGMEAGYRQSQVRATYPHLP